MGRKGVLSSAAAGGSLIAASIVLVIGVAGLIGFRGFDSANAVAEKQSVVLGGDSDAREAGAAAKPVTAVIGSAKAVRSVRSSRPAKRKAGARRGRRGKKGTMRSGLSAPAKPRSATPPAAAAAPSASAPEAPASEPASDKETPTTAAPATPVDDVVKDVTGAVEGVTRDSVESVGDVLLDVRDLLP